MAEKKNTQTIAKELQQLVVEYAKQETVDPLRNLGRYLGWGLAGSLLIGTGLILLLLSALRVLQGAGAEPDAAGQLTGGLASPGWNWVPYVIVIVLGGIMIGLLAWAISGRKTTDGR